MIRRKLLTGATSALMFMALSSAGLNAQTTDTTGGMAPGTNSDFSFTVETASPDAVWELWTTPASWGDWDLGLQSASMDGPMAEGSVGTIVGHSGDPSQFTVVEYIPEQSYAFETALPGAVLRIARFFNDDRSEFTHRVTFSGDAADTFAEMFGPGFRQALPPTMRTLEDLAGQN